MAKKVKKKNRKMRRQVRKTIGALLMVSAITVAALPVQDISANPTETLNKDDPKDVKIAVWDKYHYIDNAGVHGRNECESTIPYVRDCTDAKYKQIYTDETGTYQFAYIPQRQGDTNRVAVILKFSGGSANSTVTIPDRMEAYRQLAESESRGNYCVVNQDNNFLYYKDIEQLSYNNKLLWNVVDLHYETTAVDEDGKSIAGNTFVVDNDQLSNGKFVVPEPAEMDEETRVSVVDYLRTDTNKIMVRPGEYEVMEHTGLSDYKPCLSRTRDSWKDITYDTGRLFYYDEKNTKYEVVGSANEERVIADVKFIGAEKIEEDTANPGTWKLVETDGIIDEPGEGVFAGNSYIVTLNIGENIEGIGDYAFQGCGALTSVSFSGLISTISNGAFANCIGLTSVNMEAASNIKAIGKDAFYHCTNLSSFLMPLSVVAIGDSAFEDCTRLQSVDLCTGTSGDTLLEAVGYHVFKDCSSLTSLTFPGTYPRGEGTDEIDICCFENCGSLQFIKTSNPYFKIVDKDTNSTPHDCVNDGIHKDTFSYIFKEGLKILPASFYFEGLGYVGSIESEANKTSLHKTANDKEIAFKYLDQELYELVIKEEPDAKITYQVDNFNDLKKVGIDGNPENITIPATIGPYGIKSIGSGSFNNLQCCNLKKITIPASVQSIGTEAFKGCHNLTSVIFEDASTIQDIGRDAFKTQVTSCDHGLYNPNDYSTEEEKALHRPKLTFVGAMMNGEGNDTVPFQYAMNKWASAGETNINNPNQEKIWITCHSGWPTNLEVRYNHNAITGVGEAELQSYPRYSIIGGPDAELQEWIEALPYTDGKCTDTGNGKPGDDDYEAPSTACIYYNKVKNSIKKHNDPEQYGQPSEEEVAIYNSAKNVVVPTSVDSIKDGLFSGLTYDGAIDKDNGKPVYDGNPDSVAGIVPDTEIETITLNGVNKVDSYTFSGCTALREVAVIGAQTIEDYAFDALDGTTSLSRVVLGTNIADTINPDGTTEYGIGKRPFKDCDKLAQIECLGNNLAYQDGLLFQTVGGKTLVQCLPGRGSIIGNYEVDANELAGVTSIREEAFEECDVIGKVDLSKSSIEEIPERCFADMEELNSVVLPNTASTIEKDSFIYTPRLRVVTIPANVSIIEQDAFKADDESRRDNEISFECVAGSVADRYANNARYPYIKSVQGKVFLTHEVYFYDRDPMNPSKTDLLDKQTINDGEDAIPPTPNPTKAGYEFTGWTPYTNIVKDTDVYANYVPEGAKTYTVIFIDGVTGEQLGDAQIIEEGKSAVPPTPLEHDGYTYNKWSHDYNNIQKDMIITAQYTDNSGDASRHTVKFVYYDGTQIVTVSTQYVDHEGAATTPQSPTRTGYTFVGWDPSEYSSVITDMTISAVFTASGGSSPAPGGGGGTSPAPGGGSKDGATPTPSATPNPEDSVKKYTVSVSGGSGSGSYPAGAIVAINAYDRGAGQVFDKWTTSSAGVGFANAEVSSTTFTMPAANVSITATYKTGNGSSSSSGASSGSGGSGGSGSTNSRANNGTTVQVTKPGISNTNLAGATVSGATDNFIVKVTEDDAASQAATTALQARFGDLSRIKYFPMDISLYDSEGRTKIADTSGISVNLTLPLPDELIQYAGNNKVAAITGGALEDLNTRFTTVDGVPCVNFTATHFSPYVIYVDTANLTQATIDSTPKTGDPIHPKWFLAIGLACISLILFFKRDKVVVKAA